MKIAYIVYGEILAPVVRSQTWPLLSRLAAGGHEVMLLAVVSPRRLFSPAAYRDALDAAAAAVARVEVLTHLPKHWSLGNVARRARKVLRSFAPDVVHARQGRAAVVARRADVAPYVADMRGIRPEEFLLSAGKEEADLSAAERRQLATLRAIDREAIEGAGAVVCVSRAFASRLGGGPRVFAIPNGCEPIAEPAPGERARRRAELGFSAGDRVLVYSGSLAPWQCAADAVRLYARLREERPEIRLAILTHDRPGAAALLDRLGVGGVPVESLTPERTRERLPAFDAALLLRERHPVNEVAAPVKFAEYLHAGLPVILTDGIGDASGQVAEHGLGVVLPGPADEGNAGRVHAALGAFDPGRCRRFARERLTFGATVPMYLEAYRCALR